MQQVETVEQTENVEVAQDLAAPETEQRTKPRRPRGSRGGARVTVNVVKTVRRLPAKLCTTLP